MQFLFNIYKLLLIFIIIFIINKNVLCEEDEISVCKSKETCSTCIQQPGCIWCPQKRNDTYSRCFHKTAIPKDWCPNGAISEENQQTIIEHIPIETAKNKTPVQISPQKIKLRLRRGESHTIKFKYGQAMDYPVDLYYLMDLSASMYVHKEKLSTLGTILAETMRSLTSDFRLGFGSFVDKIALPFVNTHPERLKVPCAHRNQYCAPPYDFKHHLTLTKDDKTFSNEVAKARISGNLDSPEGGFDALMQAMVCTDVIGWRPKARHLLVFSTDAGYHIAGDGKLAGIIEPNDGQCHMENNKYTHGLILDYPSISQINEKAIENNINIIFAIAEQKNGRNYTKVYSDLKNKIKESSIGTLSQDSSNVVNIIKDTYDKIVDSIKIFDNFDNIFEIRYHTSCNGEKDENTNECRNLKTGSVVEFSATIKLLECPKSNLTRTYQIRPGALNETLTIEVEMVCDCKCEKNGNLGFEINSRDCSSFGNLTCGICQCENGRYGRFCECDSSSGNGDDDTSNCKPNKDDKEVCSGLGTCRCNRCKCFPRPDPTEEIYGKFCECNNFSCQKDRGQLCSGPEHGKCECGKCNCLDGWTGSACEKLNKTDNCIDPDGNGTICSGNGFCDNGQCTCIEKDGHRYSGKYCQECVTCSTHCDKFTKCVKCSIFEKENQDLITCKQECSKFEYENKTEKIVQHNSSLGEYICTIPIGKCNGIFKFSYEDNDKVTITTQEILICPDNVDIFMIVAGVIGSIVLAGLVMLITWKAVTSFHDRREYAKFENERKNAQWHRGENPLFKNPTSHFNNPMYDSTY